MEPKFQTSFIPKKPIVTTSGSSVSVVRETNILSIVATVLFISTVLSTGLLFIYKNSLSNKIAAAGEEIVSIQPNLQTDVIQNLVDSDSRINASKALLEKHVVVSKMLQLFQELTVKKMRFSSLVYKNKDGIPTITTKAEVQTYNALVEQERIFSENEFIRNPQFADFNLTDNGYITVSFTTAIDQKLVSYKNAIDALTLPTQ